MTTAHRARAARPPDLIGSESGAALVFSLLGLAVLTILGLGLTGIGVVSTAMTVNDQRRSEALAIADAGVAHAKKLILWQEWASLNQFLQNGDGVACNGDELAAAPTAPLPAGYPSGAGDFIPQTGVAYASGRYTVAVCDDHATDVDPITAVADLNPNIDVDKTILIRATGVGPGGAVATVEQVITATPLPAILVNGNLGIPGSPMITGTGGIAHANGSMAVAGNPCALSYNAVSTVTVSGVSAGSGTTCSSTDLDTRPDSPPLNLPIVDPTTYKPQASYWLENNGTIYNNATGAFVASLPGWTWSNALKRWTSGSTIPQGTYWVNANIVVGGSPGSAGTPLPLSLLSTLSIDVAGSPRTVPALTVTNLGPAPTGISAIAGTDLKLAGSSTQTFTGVYYAGHQIDVAGSPTVNGQILARNLADTAYAPGTYNLVPLVAGVMVITGSPTVTFNGLGIAGTGAGRWRECRTTVDPTNPCGNLVVP